MAQKDAPKKDAGKTDAKAGEAPPKSKTGLVAALMLVLGLAVGGGGAAGYFLFLAPKPPAEGVVAEAKPAEEEAEKAKPEYFAMDRMMVPMIDQRGLLVGYLSLDLSLEIDPLQADVLKNNLPIVRHTFNEVMSTVPLGRADNPKLLDFPKAQAALVKAANEALGEPVVKQLVIVSALPV
jgi:flagellar basal body-associated protein FliL